jgi:microcompartment protein CcmL/EutN
MKRETEHEMRDEYTKADLGVGTRGKYYKAYQSSHNIVRLTPEVAEVFPDEDSVNEALLELIRIARKSASTGRKADG